MQHLMLIAILLFATVGGWSVKKAGRKQSLTISQHVGQHSITQIVFGIIGSMATLTASTSLFFWLLPHYKANILSYIVFGLVMIGFLIAAVVPYIKNTPQGTIHNVAAWGMCYIIPVATLFALFWPISNIVRSIGAVLLTALIALLVLFAIKRELRHRILPFQIVYLTIFFAFLLLTTYF